MLKDFWISSIVSADDAGILKNGAKNERCVEATEVGKSNNPSFPSEMNATSSLNPLAYVRSGARSDPRAQHSITTDVV
jgi:hypothetical protein